MNALASLIILAADAHGGADTPSLMQPEVSLIVWTWIWFFLLFGLLRLMAWPKIQEMLKKRADDIEKEIVRGREIREQGEALQKEYQGKIDNIRKEMEDLRERGRKQGEELKAQIEAKARQEADEMKARAQREIDLMVDKARAELRNEVVRLALNAAEQVVKKTLQDADHRRLAEEAVAAVSRR